MLGGDYYITLTRRNKLQVLILLSCIETWAHLFPLRFVSPDITMTENLSIWELLLQFMKQQNESILLFRCAVVYRFAVAIDTSDIGYVDGCTIISLHSVAHLLDGQKLMGASVGGNNIVVTR